MVLVALSVFSFKKSTAEAFAVHFRLSSQTIMTGDIEDITRW